MRREQGFTIIELVAVLALTSVLASLGAVAIRHYSRVQTLESGTDEMVTRLRRLQEQVVSEGFPLVYGARFVPGSTNWAVVRYDPANGSCRTTVHELTGGLFSTELRVSGTTLPTSTKPEETACRTAESERFLFFYSRGTATAGSITLHQPALNRSETITATGITGRLRRT